MFGLLTFRKPNLEPSIARSVLYPYLLSSQLPVKRFLSNMPTHFDALFLGSGQSANPLAKLFASHGRKTALVERSALGGTCVNVGCTPTKTIIASGRVAYLARRGKDFGIKTEDVEVDMVKVRNRKREIVKQWNSGSVKGLESAGVSIYMGAASFVSPKEVKVSMEGGRTETLTADLIFVSSGERANKPDIPGLADVEEGRVCDSTSIMELDAVPHHLIVFGGGYIGLEFGQLFRRLGSEVSIIQRAQQLVPKEDADIAECLREILEEDGCDIHLSSVVRSVKCYPEAKETPFVVHMKTPSGEVASIAGSHILLAAGRVPNTDTLNVAAAGIKTTPKGHIVVDDKLQTNVSGIYALGDVHGGPAFTHMSYDDARIIRTNLLPHSLGTMPPMQNTQSSASRVLTPYVMYTDPQLGHIGLHDRDLKDRATKTAVMPMSRVARAVETAEARGMIKATIDADSGEILGFTCLGIEGGEVMSVVQAAMMGRLKWWDMEAAVWAHPTLAESLNNLWAYLK